MDGPVVLQYVHPAADLDLEAGRERLQAHPPRSVDTADQELLAGPGDRPPGRSRYQSTRVAGIVIGIVRRPDGARGVHAPQPTPVRRSRQWWISSETA